MESQYATRRIRIARSALNEQKPPVLGPHDLLLDDFQSAKIVLAVEKKHLRLVAIFLVSFFKLVFNGLS